MRKLLMVLMLLGIIVPLGTMAAAQAPPVELHGYVQNRAYSLEGDAVFMQVERVSLSATAAMENGIRGYVEVYVHPSLTAATNAQTYLESAYADFPLGDEHGNLRVGKGRGLNFGITPSYPNRKTSNYGIFAEAFTQDRITGIQYYNKVRGTDYGATLETTPRVGARLTGDPGPNRIPMLADRDLQGDINRSLAGTARVSRQFTPALRAGASASVGQLTATDLTSLNTLMVPTGGIPFTGDTRTRWGVDATFKDGDFVAQSEYIKAETSSLDHSGWYVLAGWEAKDSVRFYARYAEVYVGVTPVSTLPATWDRSQISLSIVKPIAKGIWLQLEQEFNEEKVFEADNDVTFLELFIGF